MQKCDEKLHQISASQTLTQKQTYRYTCFRQIGVPYNISMAISCRTCLKPGEYLNYGGHFQYNGILET